MRDRSKYRAYDRAYRMAHKAENAAYRAAHREEAADYIRAHPEIRAISNARQRCNDPKNPDYRHYGARGIKCLLSPKELLKLIGPKPGPGYSLDRINNDGNYEVGNVRWATWSQQSKNRRSWTCR